MRRFARILMLLAIWAGAFWPSAPGAQEFQTLQGDQLRAALEGQTVIYANGARQEFRASGRTLYNSGRDSWGYWRTENDQYCSMWPPSDLWACYDLRQSGAQLRFIGAAGEITEGRIEN